MPRIHGSVVDALTLADVPGFWARSTVLPLIVPAAAPGRSVVTFCWRDQEAEAVLLFANRLTDETELDATLLEHLSGTDLWHASFEMDDDWRASYAFLVQRPGEPAPWVTDGQVALRAALDRGHADPRNPDRCRNRAGVEQSVVTLPTAPPQPWLAERPGVSRGRVTLVAGPDGRDTWLYDPPGDDPRAELPLVVALDGEVWTSGHSLATTLDNLLADGQIPPARAVLPASGGTAARWEELGEGGAADSLMDALVPWAHERRRVTTGRVAVVGQSLGGLTALRAGLRHPDRVTAVVSQSASLWMDDLAPDVEGVVGEPRIHLAHGSQEWVLSGPHADLAARLRTAGVEVHTVTHNGGHDYAWWRGDLADGLTWTMGAWR